MDVDEKKEKEEAEEKEEEGVKEGGLADEEEGEGGKDKVWFGRWWIRSSDFCGPCMRCLGRLGSGAVLMALLDHGIRFRAKRLQLVPL